jgi:MFS superfamily sulfate permease-like transporter
MNAVELGAWSSNWLWGLPLIVLNVVIHVVGLGLINERVVRVLGGTMKRRRFMPTFAAVMSVIVVLATILHAVEAAIWAAVYRLLGALPDSKSAMLYSLGAITTYGHANLFLEDQWKMMGALEALNGMLLFGLTTAFLFAMIEKLWLLGRLERPPKS